LTELRCPPAVVVGHSMGGLVGSVLAVEYPHQVAALVAVDPGYLVADELIDGLASTMAAARVSDPVPVVQALLGATETASPPFLRTWHSRRIAGMPRNVLVEALESMSAGPGISSLRSAGEGYLAKRRCPVLSVYAEPSRVPVETALFTDGRSQAVVWEGTGHWLHQERPDAFNTLVDSWMAGLW
jgi:pimeloyl-ACP methyl ester carboxylesterase